MLTHARAVALAVMTASLAACGGQSVSETTPAATAAAATVAATTPSPFAPSVIPGTPIPPAVSVTGLFADPRPRPSVTPAALGGRIPTFSPWDGESTMLLDTATGDEINLGPGRYGVFSPNGAKMAWVATGANESFQGEAWVIDLESRERTPLGEARGVRFLLDGRLVIGVGSNGADVVDLATGDRTSIEAAAAFNPPFPVTTADGFELRQRFVDTNGPAYRSELTLHDPNRNVDLLRFEAYQATPAGPGYLAVATDPVLSEVSNEQGPIRARGTTNIFLVDISTGVATFIATSGWSYANWPLAASERYVAWTDEYCTYPDPGRTRIYDRVSGNVIELDASLWVDDITPEGILAVGEFGADALIDIETLEYTAVLPDNVAADNSWSPDYRYASIGRALGHGGLCP